MGCQLNSTHGFSMNEDETNTPQGRLWLAPKQYHGQVQRNSWLNIFKQNKKNPKNNKLEKKQDTNLPEIPNLNQTQKDAAGLKNFGVISFTNAKQRTTPTMCLSNFTKYL